MSAAEYSHRSDEQLLDDIRLYGDLRWAPETLRDKVRGWYGMLGLLFGVGAVLNAFLNGVDWVSGVTILVSAPGVWLMHEHVKRLQAYDREIARLKAEANRRGIANYPL